MRWLTTVLDLIGAALVVLGVAAALWLLSAPLALGVAGLMVLGVSWLSDRSKR